MINTIIVPLTVAYQFTHSPVTLVYNLLPVVSISLTSARATGWDVGKMLCASAQSNADAAEEFDVHGQFTQSGKISQETQ